MVVQVVAVRVVVGWWDGWAAAFRAEAKAVLSG